MCIENTVTYLMEGYLDRLSMELEVRSVKTTLNLTLQRMTPLKKVLDHQVLRSTSNPLQTREERKIAQAAVDGIVHDVTDLWQMGMKQVRIVFY